MVEGGAPGRRAEESAGGGRRREFLALLAAGTAGALAGCGFGATGPEPAVPKLAAGDAGDRFGASVALDGDAALVGAPGAVGPSGTDAGAAYVFGGGSPSGAWTRRAKLAAGDAGDRFGASVALDGDTALVGAPGASSDRGRGGRPDGEPAGAAYVFSREGGTSWRREAALGPDPESGIRFGASVGLDGDTALVGIVGDTDLRFGSAAAAHVFVREAGEWVQRATLAPDDRRGDGLDVSVALDGDTALVGDLQDESFSGLKAGGAYAFSRADGTWRQEAALVREDDGSFGEFGASVALDGDAALVGGPWTETDGGERTGAAYAFSRTGGAWSPATELVSGDGDDGDRFGASVALDGDAALVGAWGEGRPNGELAGAAYAFTRSDGTWTRAAKLAPADGGFLDKFGVAVALDGDAALVGSDDDDPSGESGGAAYVYDL